MGLAASKSWISQGISCGNTDESPILRGRGTVLEALDINCKDMRMLSARTGDKLRAISEEILGWRAGYIERCKSGSEGGTRYTYCVTVPTLLNVELVVGLEVFEQHADAIASQQQRTGHDAGY